MSVLLQFTRFKELSNWSVKTNLAFSLFKSRYNFVKLEKLIQPRKEKIKKDDYKGNIDIVKKITFNDGKIYLREKRETGMDMYNVYPYDLLVSNINFHQGALSINKYDFNILCSTHYQPYIINNNLIHNEYLEMLLRSKIFQKYIIYFKSEGIKTESKYNFIKDLKIPLPPLEVQKELVKNHHKKLNLANQQLKEIEEKEKEIEKYLYKELGIEILSNNTNNKILNFARFKDLENWGVSKQNSIQFTTKYNLKRLDKCCFDFKNGVNFNKSQFGKGDKFVNIKDVYSDKYVDLKLLDRITIDKNKLQSNLLKNNDLVFVRSSVKYEGVGFPSLIKLDDKDDKITFCGFVIKCSIDINIINPDFLLFILRSSIFRNIVIERSNKSTITNIAQPSLKSLDIPLPPLTIQNEIANYIQIENDKVLTLKQQSIKNKTLALSEFENKVFNEA